MKTVEDVRSELFEFLQQDLIGPANGDEEVLDDKPRLRYAAGVLFPQEVAHCESASVGGVEDDEVTEPEINSSDLEEEWNGEETIDEKPQSRRGARPEAEHDEAIALANSYKPSAIGMSFMVANSGSTLIIKGIAAVYKTGKKPSPDGTKEWPCWRRCPLDLPVFEFSDFGNEISKTKFEFAEGLTLHVVCRPRKNGQFLLTTSMYNSTFDGSSKALTFFQVGLEVVTKDTNEDIVEYQTLDGAGDDPEEVALAMLYQNRRVFGIGHGCAVTWESFDGRKASKIQTETFPSVVVPPVVPLSGGHDYLSMQFLAGDCSDPERMIPLELEEFCAVYEKWIETREVEASTLASCFKEVGSKHLDLCRTTLDRMRSGIAYMKSDKRVFEAFMLTNRAMLMQQHHSRLRRGLNESWDPLPGEGEYYSDWSKKKGYWRAFQLAFVLISITSFGENDEQVEVDGESISAREVVDLIWFPTGGGKTEAYLGVTAFVIFLERLGGRDVAGCRVLMRYTLRLLTSQQFQRASSLICACELIRRNYPREQLGKTPITIGLWVGMSLTPNQEKDALTKLSSLSKKKDNAKNPFQLLTCPWCGTELSNPRKLGYVEHRRRQIYLCPASGTDDKDRCPFSRRRQPLPVIVVDESIYKEPPTMIIGTVDKFAMLAWNENSGNIFSVGGGPKLIIQDELHLITGPLGSMVGLYESVIDYLCSRTGKRPKIIASTATIRRASLQCKALYDRPMFQFPPPGLDISDSFFAKEDSENSPGRLYVGFLPTATSSPFTAQVRGVASLLQGPLSVVAPGGSEEENRLLDPYWTLVQYFGSLKELGRAATFISADIPEFFRVLHRWHGLDSDKRRYMGGHEELTSRKNEDEIPRILKKLETKYKWGARGGVQALTTVLATNMISVGVDVDRLGLMLIVTQPKGTSEYIQASSRVGRSNSAPGLIMTLYNQGRPRDRSHYEQFRSYHDSFYRYVEPTSVTPFSPPALERGLHAVVVIAGRHIAGWKSPLDFDLNDPGFFAFLKFLKTRVEHIDPDHLPEFKSYLEDCLDQWDQNQPEIFGKIGGLRDETSLMRVAGSDAVEDDPSSWPTPTSLRNVDVECSARVISRYTKELEIEL